MHFSYATIRSQCIFFCFSICFSCWNVFHLVCCTGSIKYLIFILFFFLSYKSTMPTVLFSFFGKRYVCKPATFHRRIAANIVTNIYSFFCDLFLGFTIFFDNIHTQNKTGGKTAESRDGKLHPCQLFRFHPTWPYLLIV